MSNKGNSLTITGNLVEDPELRYTPSGVAVCNFRVASTPRRYDSQTQQWEDGDSLFLTCNVWRNPAENVANSLAKGMRVIVTGSLKQRSYEKDGQQRTAYEIEVDEVGPSLRTAVAQVQKATPQQPGGQQGGFSRQQGLPQAQQAIQGGFPGAQQQGGQQQGGGFPPAQHNDPWGDQPSY